MHYTFLIVLKFSLHQTKGLVIICNGYSTVTQMEACSLTLHIEDILMLNSSWFFFMSFFVVVLSPPKKKPPEKTITSKFTNLHFNLFKLRVFTCMYVKLHNIACYYMYWIVFGFFETQTIPFFKHLSNPAHLFYFRW